MESEDKKVTPLVTVITPTGSRPVAFKLCEQFVTRQTYKNIQWIVVDDSLPITGEPVTRGIRTTIPSLIEWKPGLNTQRLSIMAALPLILGEYIFFCEDDDNYQPTYIETYVDLLKTFDVVGEGNAKYYHLPSKSYKEMRNLDHTSLAQVAFRRNILPLFELGLHSGEIYFDIKFWQLIKETSFKSLIFCNQNLSIGIKGLPGRPGIGIGHRPENFESDPFLSKLEEWVGSDVELYKEYTRGKKR